MFSFKNIIRNAILFALPLGGVGGGLSSCSDFLKEEDKDKMIPETVEQYEAMLHKEAFLNVSWFYRSEFMTDCITENPLASTSAKNGYKSLYSWQRDVERDGSGNLITSTNSMWSQLYADVLVANYIIERATTASGSESARNYLLAEAYFVRARAYLELANIYAEPYKAATATTTQGVPLRLGTGVSNSYQRASLAEVYTQIESDLAEAISLFDQSKTTMSLWHPNRDAAQLLLSRAYLYKGEWQKVVDATADLAVRQLYNFVQQPNSPVITTSNPEVLHTYGNPAYLIIEGDGSGQWQQNVPNIYSESGVVSYCCSEALLNAFHPGDCRPYTFFTAANDGVDVPAKWNSQYTQLGAYSYRVSEAYLSRAEALVMLGKRVEAETLLRKFLASRVSNSAANVQLPDTDTELLHFILDERWREFCCEGTRWYDLRRAPADYRPQLTHDFTLRSSASGTSVGTVQGSESFTLRAGSPNYTFEIPLSETEINTTITPYGKRE